MAALTTDRATARRRGKLVSYQVAASTTIYAGSMLQVVAGYATPMTKASNKLYIGMADEACDNSSGSAGDQSVIVRRGGAVQWTNATTGKILQADVGKHAYAIDDQTVSKTSTGATSVGEILGVDGDGVWVL